MPTAKFSHMMMLLACVTGFAATPSAYAQGRVGLTDKQLAQRAVQYAALDPVAISKGIVVHADDLDAVATFSSEAACKNKGGYWEVRSDPFLRVLIDRKTGATVWQVYITLVYGFGRREFHDAVYSGQDGPVGVPLAISDTDVTTGLLGLIYEDTIAFDIPETVARDIANAGPAALAKPWRFRLKSNAGLDWTDDLPGAEFAGMLMAVERWRRDNPVRKG